MTTYDYEAFEVEIRQTVRTVITVKAKNPLSAAKIVDDTSCPLPPSGAWEHDYRQNWEYIVRDSTGAELYRGDAQELS
jgi:hypothetical protein